MVDILKKDLGDVKGLEGKSLEDQFDMLEFLAYNKPAPKKVGKKKPNKPILGTPTSQDKKMVGNLISKTDKTLSMTFDTGKMFRGEYFK